MCCYNSINLKAVAPLRVHSPTGNFKSLGKIMSHLTRYLIIKMPNYTSAK